MELFLSLFCPAPVCLFRNFLTFSILSSEPLGQFSSILGTNHPEKKGIQFFLTKGQTLFQREITKNHYEKFAIKKLIKNPARKAVTFSENIISGEDFLGTIFA